MKQNKWERDMKNKNVHLSVVVQVLTKIFIQYFSTVVFHQSSILNIPYKTSLPNVVVTAAFYGIYAKTD